MRCKHYIWLIVLGALGCSKSADVPSEKIPNAIKLISTEREFTADDSIVFKFDGKTAKQLLLIQNGWGTIALQPDSTNTDLTFTLPQTITQKSGLAHWSLHYQKTKVAEGSINILPSKTLSESMESYIGPTSIFADNQDEAMIVSLPQDTFGNPLPDRTIIELTEKFKNVQNNTSMPIQGMIAHAYVGGHSEIGELFLGTSIENQVSKEFTVSVLPTKSADFNITMERQHHFADGNQIVSFTTSTVKDRNGNTIADGTMVNFVVEDSSGNQYQTYGQTLNGIAVGKMLHPEAPTQWKVKAHISGLSQSNSLELDFEAAVRDYTVHVSENGRTITVGPILSYMKQWIPDGMGIYLEIKGPDGELLLTQETTSRKGMGKFELPENMNAHENTMIITVAGIEKRIEGTIE
ncbi:hypothetical protein GUA46_13770 [Muricauda sp. HICW]|uniref:Uncharacterized protein n=1 Tax=Flagellimonas chongwuensis TaxID=2697365 RepID=A0A850NEY9_9FLAO|nr:hypothetical protein [Allomuricauda chongwuensis]NVN19413.1 hypothetical protein [Allomuricauda chongwuensis]